MQSANRRNPLRLIVNKESQLRILWLVLGAVFCGMSLAIVMVLLNLDWVWIAAYLAAVGTFMSLWVSRRIAGPLYRIEKDLERILQGAATGTRVHLREGDSLHHLATLVNELVERSERK